MLKPSLINTGWIQLSRPKLLFQRWLIVSKEKKHKPCSVCKQTPKIINNALFKLQKLEILEIKKLKHIILDENPF